MSYEKLSTSIEVEKFDNIGGSLRSDLNKLNILFKSAFDIYSVLAYFATFRILWEFPFAHFVEI